MCKLYAWNSYGAGLIAVVFGRGVQVYCLQIYNKPVHPLKNPENV